MELKDVKELYDNSEDFRNYIDRMSIKYVVNAKGTPDDIDILLQYALVREAYSYYKELYDSEVKTE